MCTKIKVANAAFAAFIASALHCAAAPLPVHPQAEARQQWNGNPISGAYAATNRSRRATRPASRGRVSQAINPSGATAPNGRNFATDPDAGIRFQLRRDSSMGSSLGSGGSGM